MKRMFDKFNLIAHPSFFSGVQSDALSALLKANRRTELLQLAVSGFLSFVVAADESDVVLNRTTREEFLRKLVFEKNVNVRSFDAEQTVTFARAFAENKDYDINPIEFVRAFIEKGITHFVDGKLIVSLPFVESYLLALELTARKDEAAKYFNPLDESFDVPTFDIYSELGASDDVVKSVISALVKIRSAIRMEVGETHILLTNTIRPALVGRPEKLRVFKKMLDSAVEDVVKEHPTGAKKQRMIDLAEHVDVAARSAQGSAQQPVENEPDESLVLEATRCWSIATVLLGSGSERLTKEPKRQLASEIVKTASALVDRSLKRMPKDLLGDLRRGVLGDEKLRKDLGIIDEGGQETDRLQLIQDLIDVYEFSLYGYPLHSIFSQLGNVAGQSVLGVSVASVVSDDLIETLIAKVWLGEIEATKAKKDLIGCIAKLPPVWFLRVMLVTHFLMRVFWDHWERGDRLALLDVAAETIKPLGRELDKRSIERAVETSSQ